MIGHRKPKVLEFFAGGGLARMGLNEQFETVWANDIDPAKAEAWIANFGASNFELSDVHHLDAMRIPLADLAWASFPCQDLSLAGARAGLDAKRSGAFYGFVDMIQSLKRLDRAPKILVVENVTGLLTSHGGQDFVALITTLAQLGYRAGALEIDARHFLPQSRPRVFIIACPIGFAIPETLQAQQFATSPFTTPAILRAIANLPETLVAQMIWWALPCAPKAHQRLMTLIDETDTDWWPSEKTKALVASFSPKHKDKLAAVKAKAQGDVGAIYRRSRRINGISRPYAEVRFDGIAGCLRTPSGGSSRQFLLFIDGPSLRARALNSREAMRLMGVSDAYILPKNVLTGLKIAGDGVAVPVVAWLSKHLLGPLADAMA